MLCRVPRLPGEGRSSPACLRVDHRKSSFPCSRAREPKLPSCLFQVCASALFLQRECAAGEAENFRLASTMRKCSLPTLSGFAYFAKVLARSSETPELRFRL